MADNKSNLKNESRRERIEASATSADVVAGMAAAGIGLILASDDAIAHVKTAIDGERRGSDGRDIASDPAGAQATADHEAHLGAPNDVASSASGSGDSLAAEPSATETISDAVDRASVEPVRGIDHAADHSFAADSSQSVAGASALSSTGEAVAATSGSSAAPPRVAEAVSHSANDGLDTISSVVTSTLDQIDATIASATDNIAAVGSSIGATVSNLADTLSEVGQSIISHVTDLPSTLLGAQPAVASVDQVFTNAFHDTPIADVVDSMGSFGLSDSLPAFEDFTPINLGFIGQSYTDQIEFGGHTPGGMLNGLV